MLGFRYTVERRGDRLVHRETFDGLDGKPAGAAEAEVEIVIGSGRRGGTYLFADDGYLFQSPITW